MMKRYSEKQVIGFLKEGESGVPAQELYRRHGRHPGCEAAIVFDT